MEVLQQRAGSPNIKRLLLVKESQITQLRNIALFYVWEDGRSGLTEIIPFICTSAIWGQFRTENSRPMLSFLKVYRRKRLQCDGC